MNDDVATYLNNRKRREITRLEEEGQMAVQILGSESLYPEHLELDCRDRDARRSSCRNRKRLLSQIVWHINIPSTASNRKRSGGETG